MYVIAQILILGQITTVGIVSNFLVTMGAGKLQAKVKIVHQIINH